LSSRITIKKGNSKQLMTK